jgi:hypothetical protein
MMDVPPPGQRFADEINRKFALAWAEYDRADSQNMYARQHEYKQPDAHLANNGAYIPKPAEKVTYQSSEEDNNPEATINLSSVSLKDFISHASTINVQDQLILQPASAIVTVQPTLEEMLATAKAREKSL